MVQWRTLLAGDASKVSKAQVAPSLQPRNPPPGVLNLVQHLVATDCLRLSLGICGTTKLHITHCTSALGGRRGAAYNL